MPETTTTKPNLHALGEHFTRALGAHATRHEQTATQAERDQNLMGLRDRLSNIYSAPHEGLGNKLSTKTYDVDRLDTGTKVAALLSSHEPGGPKAVAEDLVTIINEGTRGSRYMREGALSARFTGIYEMGDETAQQIPAGLEVKAALETTEGTHTTRDTVFVGEVLDPESIKVPEVNEDPNDHTPRFRVIGSDDSRFGPIMDMVAHVNQGVGSRGEVSHVG